MITYATCDDQFVYYRAEGVPTVVTRQNFIKIANDYGQIPTFHHDGRVELESKPTPKATLTQKITGAVHARGDTTYSRGNNLWTLRNETADEFARMSGQRIERHPDGSCSIEDLPPPKPTALDLIDQLKRSCVLSVHVNSMLSEIRTAIHEGRVR